MNNILFLANSGWNIVNFREDLIKKINKKKYKIIISCPNDNFIKDFLNKNSYEFIPIYFDRKSTNVLSNLKLFINIFFLYFKVRPKLVFMFTIKPNIFGNLVSFLYPFKNKQINFITGFGTFYLSDSFFKKLILILFKISFKKSYMTFFQNKNDYNYFISKNIVKKNNSRVIGGSGIDLIKFPFKNIQKKNKNNLIFLCASRLIKDKGIIEYLEAAKNIKKKYRNITFILLGSIDKNNLSYLDSDTLKKYTMDYVKHYEFDFNIKKFLYNCDCAILPSYREGASRFLLEAASTGRPIIATDVPGCNNIVFNNYNGYLCNKSSTASLFNAIEKMINTPFNIRKSMSKSSRLVVENNFDINKVNNEILTDLKLY